jgi:hypothetical protein
MAEVGFAFQSDHSQSWTQLAEITLAHKTHLSHFGPGLWDYGLGVGRASGPSSSASSRAVAGLLSWVLATASPKPLNSDLLPNRKPQARPRLAELGFASQNDLSQLLDPGG